MGKIRAFVVTNWNLNTDTWYEENKTQVQFVAYGNEMCPNTKRAHQQVFLYFFNPKSDSFKNLNKIGNSFGPIHCNVEPMRGSFQQNEAYCSKEGAYTKLGQEPAQGTRGDIMEVKNMIHTGELTADDICWTNPEFYHKYGRTIRELEAISLRNKFRTWMTQGTWLYGPTGVGKSHTAFENYHPTTHYIKTLEDQWWDGYTGQSTVIINEFRGQITFSELLDLLDKWPKTVKQRCKAPVPFLAKNVIITSSKHPSDIYSNCGDRLDQLYRRCSIHKMEQKYSEVIIDSEFQKNNNTSPQFFDF